MATTERNDAGVIPPALLVELQEAARRAAKGIRDPEAMRLAAERVDRLREENRQTFGVQDSGVRIIRESRGRM
ncbi:MAG: hypothetical protein ACJ8F7_23200 [Gemmataceae bacterium]